MAEKYMTAKDDTISRQAAIDALDEYIEEYSFDLDENGYHNPKWCAMQEAKMTIQRLPSAERRGRWDDSKVAFHRVCSECGAVIRQDVSLVYLLECMEKVGALNYCPNCGAAMCDTISGKESD